MNMMKAHIHRLPEAEAWKHGINAMIDGELYSVVADTSEYGYTRDVDAALIVALRNNAEALLDRIDDLIKAYDSWQVRCGELRTEMIKQRVRAEKAEAERDDLAGIAGVHKAEADRLRAEVERLNRAVTTLDRTDDELADAVLKLRADNDRLGRELTARGRGDLIRKDGGS
jgi:chromosome segregation ATPase